MNLDNIPPKVWVIFATSWLIFIVSVALVVARSQQLTVKVLDFKLESTAKLNKVVKASDNLENKINQVQEREAKISALTKEIQQLRLSHYNRQRLKPKIEAIEELSQSEELEQLNEEVQQISEEAIKEIDNLTKDVIDDMEDLE